MNQSIAGVAVNDGDVVHTLQVLFNETTGEIGVSAPSNIVLAQGMFGWGLHVYMASKDPTGEFYRHGTTPIIVPDREVES